MRFDMDVNDSGFASLTFDVSFKCLRTALRVSGSVISALCPKWVLRCASRFDQDFVVSKFPG